jgi:hypothetical protein
VIDHINILANLHGRLQEFTDAFDSELNVVTDDRRILEQGK